MRKISAYIAGLLIGFVVTLMAPVVFFNFGGLAACTPDESSDHDHGHGDSISLPPGPTAPTLGVEIHKDARGGLNLSIQTTNFRFAPESVDGAHRSGEGHAHVYVNGKKVGRVYGESFHIGNPPRGEVKVTVTLNSNDHRALAVNGAPIQVTKSLTID